MRKITSGATASATLTRPANLTAYAAGDVVGGAVVLDFDAGWPHAGRKFGADAFVTSVQVRADIAAIPAGMTSMRVHLYAPAPASALADNAPFDLTAGDRAAYLGYVEVGPMVALGSTAYARANVSNFHVALSSGRIGAYLVTVGGFTPAANSETYAITAHLSRL